MATGGEGTSGGAPGAPPQQYQQQGPKRLRVVLPWLLVTSGRLTAIDVMNLACQCGLASILELSLTKTPEGTMKVRRPLRHPLRKIGFAS